ncbi:glycosyltransferase family 4 protein [Candidatus Margulisiibacteriota bacterium]
MKIPKKFLYLMVCSERWDEGGAHIIHPLEISKELIRRGHEVILFIPKVKRLAQEIDIPYVMVPAPRIFKGSSFIFFEFLLPFYVAKALKKAKYKNKQALLYTRHREIGLASLMIRDIFKTPFIDEYNDVVTETLDFFIKHKMYSRWERFLKSNPLSKFIITGFEKIIFKNADAVIAVTPELKKYILKLVKINQRKVTVIPNGCNINTINIQDKMLCRKKLGLAQDDIYLCHIGSLNPWQGIDDVLDSLALLIKESPKTKLLLIGEGPYRDNLERKIADLNLEDHVIFTGHLPHEKINTYIGASDICMFLKTLTSYGLSSLKLYEYLAAGKPIIGRDIPSISFIKKNDVGILLPLNASPKIVKDAIKKFLNRPDLELVCKRARHLAETVYNWGKSAESIENISQEL